MSIKKYEVLLQTADLGSFTKASEVLGYTQSAISHIVTGLEDELGLKLLTRDRFGVRLTPEGEALRCLPAKSRGHPSGRPVPWLRDWTGAHRHLPQCFRAYSS